MSASPYVLETTADTFEADVIERSRSVPVVLDFWAAWCQPCRLLAPLLERMADEHAGQFVLVKADTDQVPQYASAFNVQGIPAVFGLRNGEVVDFFTGLLTESQLREWLRRLIPSAAETLASEAAALEATDAAAAEAKYRQALEHDAQLPAAALGLARVRLAAGSRDEACQLLERLESRGFLEPEAQRLKAQLQLSGGTVNAGELQRLQAAVEAAPQDGAARLHLAEALLAAGQHEAGLRHCLEIVARERGPLRDQARQRMLDVFKVLGEESSTTGDYRRQLARALY